MVRVLAAQVVDVQRHQCVIDEALEEFVRQIDVERADHRTRERDVKLEPRSAGEIDDYARERFVERHVGVAIAPWRATWSSMWSRNGTPVEMSAWPLPSRPMSTTIEVSRVMRSMRAQRGLGLSAAFIALARPWQIAGARFRRASRR